MGSMSLARPRRRPDRRSDRERPVAFELFVPVYRHELRPDASVAERRRAQWDGREDVTALVARADGALYAAEEAGRDRVRADRASAVETSAP
jgi:GGDEF domain-containing protein